MIKVIARQQKLQFQKNGPVQWRYVLKAENYSKLNEAKVIEEASTHSGIGKGALKGAWDAIGDVIKAWVTEGHSVTIPGLGTMRFSIFCNFCILHLVFDSTFGNSAVRRPLPGIAFKAPETSIFELMEACCSPTLFPGHKVRMKAR